MRHTKKGDRPDLSGVAAQVSAVLGQSFSEDPLCHAALASTPQSGLLYIRDPGAPISVYVAELRASL
jgi:hypothetical protein